MNRNKLTAISNSYYVPTMEPEPISELQQSTSPGAPKLTWGEIMDTEDNVLENVEPFCFYSTDNINQVEEQKVETKNVEKRIEEQAKVLQMPVTCKKIPKERLSKDTKAISNSYYVPTMEPEPISELQQSTSPGAPKLTWGEIMDTEDNVLENVEPFCFYSTDNINQVEEQKVETKNVEKRIEEQAKVLQMPVTCKKIPKERLSKDTKILLHFVTYVTNCRETGFVQTKEVHGAWHRERMERSPKEPHSNPHQAQKKIQLQRE
ncbi:hypothetical protein Q7C36_012386 [Tachysurus vachellii]|uniref:Uncharacterized protein n=1 Tax=Tachysurus vachellii TaxID=175792 RepID=A0AA88MPD5_TACVA|nr:hypothetical protein Q7C36_012386 [Tachysurus vachellii]